MGIRINWIKDTEHLYNSKFYCLSELFTVSLGQICRKNFIIVDYINGVRRRRFIYSGECFSRTAMM